MQLCFLPKTPVAGGVVLFQQRVIHKYKQVFQRRGETGKDLDSEQKVRVPGK